MSILMPLPEAAREAGDVLPQPWRWTREDFHRALELGFFSEDDPIELIAGELYAESPQSRIHYKAIKRVARVLRQAFGEDYSVDEQGPAAMNVGSEPEPDVTVVRGDFEDYDDHPSPPDIALVVEVSDTSLAKDRLIKGGNYARAGIRDYWLLNLKNRTLEMRRGPGPVEDDETDIRYRSLAILGENDSVTPLELAGTEIPVATLFQPSRRRR